MYIPFNRPFIIGREIEYIRQSIANTHISGNGPFSKRCHSWLENNLGCQKALLTHSGTAALEMAAILAGIQPGDEIIMPSYTFVSTANAFALRGGVPVFVDIRPDNLNLDENQIEKAISPRTKIIVPVHYGGVGCEMDQIMDIAERKSLIVVEDAAQGIMSTYKKRSLGSIGHLAALSFHETKNIISGEGGALLINDPKYIERAEIIWEKGTNRNQFFRGQVDKYTWIDLGSSYLPSDITAAFLLAQLEEVRLITEKRLQTWDFYHQGFAQLEKEEKLRRPAITPGCKHNANIYFLIMPTRKIRDSLLKKLNAVGVNAVFHYIPLHSSPFGEKHGRIHGRLLHTQNLSERLIRLPLWHGMEKDQIEYVITQVCDIIKSL